MYEGTIRRKAKDRWRESLYLGRMDKYMVKESLKNFCKYSASDEELFMYIRLNAGEWNEESFVCYQYIIQF